MSLTLYFHPLASFCHKALIALYENDIAFEPVIVDFGDAASRDALKAVWPMMKMPALRDEARDRTVAESTIVIDYLEVFCPGPVRLLPNDPDQAWQVRMWDRFFDHYVQLPMQKIVTDRLRPAGRGDPHGVGEAEEQLREAYAILEQRMTGRSWAVGKTFSLADCSAAPALFYANTVVPFAGEAALPAYLDRLKARPSFARVLTEAEPYFALFPMDRKPEIGNTVR